MEVLLAKKRLQDRIASGDAGQQLEVGHRVIVREGKEFENFRTGDEGVVVSVSEEDSRCEVHFDGCEVPVHVAIRHVSVVAADSPSSLSSRLPRKAASVAAPTAAPTPSVTKRPGSATRATVSYRRPARDDGVNDGKRTVARWKQKGDSSLPWPSKEPSTPPPPEVPATWQNGHERTSEWSPSAAAPSEGVTDLTEPCDLEASMKRALCEASSVIDANLRVVGQMRVVEEMSGQQTKVIMMSDETYAEWQRAITAMRNAEGHCTKVLAHTSTPKAAVEVPVESMGYSFRHPEARARSPVPLQNSAATPSSVGAGWAPSTAYRSTNSMNRSTSAPLLRPCHSFSNASSINSPCSASGFMPPQMQAGGPSTILSPRFMGVSSLPSLPPGHPCLHPAGPPLLGSAFIPSLPALNEAAPGSRGASPRQVASPNFAVLGVPPSPSICLPATASPSPSVCAPPTAGAPFPPGMQSPVWRPAHPGEPMPLEVNGQNLGPMATPPGGARHAARPSGPSSIRNPQTPRLHEKKRLKSFGDWLNHWGIGGGDEE